MLKKENKKRKSNLLRCGILWSYDNHRIHQNRRESRCSYLPRPFAETETKKTNVSNMVVQTQQKKIKTKEQKQLKLGIRHACRLTLTDCLFFAFKNIKSCTTILQRISAKYILP